MNKILVYVEDIYYPIIYLLMEGWTGNYSHIVDKYSLVEYVFEYYKRTRTDFIKPKPFYKNYDIWIPKEKVEEFVSVALTDYFINSFKPNGKSKVISLLNYELRQASIFSYIDDQGENAIPGFYRTMDIRDHVTQAMDLMEMLGRSDRILSACIVNCLRGMRVPTKLVRYLTLYK